MANADCNTQQQVERIGIAIDAGCEIEGLVTLLAREMEELDDDGITTLKGILMRIKGLNSVILSALGDEMESAASLQNKINGGWGLSNSAKGDDHHV